MVEQLSLRTPDPGVRGSSLSRRVVSLDKELNSTLSLFTHIQLLLLISAHPGLNFNPGFFSFVQKHFFGYFSAFY